MLRAAVIGLAGSCAAACTTEDFAPPQVDVPAAYRQARPMAKATPIRTEWWRGFRSAELTRLIEAARIDNLDIAAAVARIQQADAAARIAGAPLLPIVEGSSDVTRSRGAGFASGRVGQGATVYGLSANASYELDFWGKNRAAAAAAQLSALADRYDRQTVELTAIASAANTYFDLLGAQERLSIARENVRNASLVLATIQQRLQAGTATALDLAEQQSLLAQQRASIPPLEQTVGQDQATLALLVGQPPARLTVKGGSIDAVTVPPVSPGLPSALLTRRPDISTAEANLASADANVTVARAQFFPSIQLTGQAGLENTALKSLFEPTSTFYSLATGLTQPIFEGGRLRGQLEQARGVQAELVANYRKAVISAFSDVERALVAVRQLARQEALLRDAVASARKAYGLTEQQLEQGTVDITTVLTNQTTLYQAQVSLIECASRGCRPSWRSIRRSAAVGKRPRSPTSPEERTDGAPRLDHGGGGRRHRGGRRRGDARALAAAAGRARSGASIRTRIRTGVGRERLQRRGARRAWRRRGPAARGAGGSGGAPQGPIAVIATPVRTEDVPVTVTGVGTAQPLASVTVVPQVDGQLLQVLFREGQDVRKGDVLARLDDRSAQAALDQARAKQAQDQATLDNARRDLERYTTLAATNSVTRQQADTQRSTVAVAAALVQSDAAAVASATVTLGYATITAPIDGRTGILNVDQGSIVRASDATGIVTISQIRPIAVLFTVPQQQLAAINRASAEGPLDVDLLDGTGTVIDHGTLLVVDNQVDQTTGTVRLKASFPNDQLGVWPGAFVNARLHVSTLKDALVIPSQAVQRGPDGTFVYRVRDQQTAEMVKVTVGQQDDRQAVIARGLAAGDPVITTGFVRLTDGSKVQVADPDAAPADAAAPDQGRRRAGQGERSGGQGDGSRRRPAFGTPNGAP